MTTKQEFIDMILEAGNGIPIDVALLHVKSAMNLWFRDNYDIKFRSGTIEITILKLFRLWNPPIEKADIWFRIDVSDAFSKRRWSMYDELEEILDEVAVEAVNKLRFLTPIEEKQVVEFPKSSKKMLFGSADEPTDYEWGGGIDFEIVEGKPQIERILSYFGEYGEIPTRVFNKYKSDIEVRFHTHPNRKFALPSKPDILLFINSHQQVEFIISKNEMLILEKTKNTPENITEIEIEQKTPHIGYARHRVEDQIKDLKIIENKYKLKTRIVKYNQDIELDLNVVRKYIE